MPARGCGRASPDAHPAGTPGEHYTAAEVEQVLEALAVDFFVSLLRTVEAWSERPHAEIEGWGDLMPSGEKNETALEKIRQLPVRTPEEALEHVSRPPESQMRTGS